ncbi:MAG: SRPBCC family protein [Deltaproteobacteria bacterium]
MKLEGTFMVPAPRETVWQHLMNPDTLSKSLPGCEKLEAQPDGSFHAEMKVGIGAVKGAYKGRVELFDQVAPERFRIKVDGKGTGGFLKAEGMLTLLGAGQETLVGYTGEAQVGGVIAGVGQRMVLGAARQIVQHFFQTFSKIVTPPG